MLQLGIDRDRTDKDVENICSILVFLTLMEKNK